MTRTLKDGTKLLGRAEYLVARNALRHASGQLGELISRCAKKVDPAADMTPGLGTWQRVDWHFDDHAVAAAAFKYLLDGTMELLAALQRDARHLKSLERAIRSGRPPRRGQQVEEKPKRINERAGRPRLVDISDNELKKRYENLRRSSRCASQIEACRQIVMSLPGGRDNHQDLVRKAESLSRRLAKLLRAERENSDG